MEFQDKTLTCKDCGKEFVFTSGEQSFYSEKGFENEPARCKECRIDRKRERRSRRQFFDVTCADCGAETKVPFKPTQNKPVYCRDCYAKKHPETANI